MSETKYILIYPFESRERAFDVANDIDGSLMWQNGTAYPRDNIPAFITPVAEFSGRWTAPNQAEQQQQTIKELASALDHALHYIGDADSGFIRQYQALAAQHLKDK